MANYCSKCGMKVLADSVFCQYCGNQLIKNNFPQRSSHSVPEKFTRNLPTRSPRGSSTPYYYHSYDRSSSNGLKWFVIGISVFIIFGLVIASALVVGFFTFYSIDEDRLQPRNDYVDFGSVVYTIETAPNELQFSARIRNDGNIAANPCRVPISWEDSYYEIQLVDGSGILNETTIGLDLNGDNDINDTFDITWQHSSNRRWDASINDGGQDIYAYSIFEGSSEYPGSVRSYSINGQSKLFEIGNQTHALYMAYEDYALFGLCNAFLEYHDGPCWELLVNSKLNITDLKINGVQTWIDFNKTLDYKLLNGSRLVNAYTISIPNPGVWPSEEVSISGTLNSDLDISNTDVVLLMNWAYEDIRYVWSVIEEYTTSI